MSNIAEKVIIFYIPNSINHNFSLSNITQSPSTRECSVPESSAGEWEFMDGETDFRDGDGNPEALAGTESDFSNEDQEWDAETLYSRESGFSTEDQEIGADSNEEMLVDNEANDINQIWAMIEYGVLDSIVLSL